MPLMISVIGPPALIGPPAPTGVTTSPALNNCPALTANAPWNTEPTLEQSGSVQIVKDGRSIWLKTASDPPVITTGSADAGRGTVTTETRTPSANKMANAFRMPPPARKLGKPNAARL